MAETFQDAVSRLVASRMEQGLPRYVENPATLATIAAAIIPQPAIEKAATASLAHEEVA